MPSEDYSFSSVHDKFRELPPPSLENIEIAKNLLKEKKNSFSETANYGGVRKSGETYFYTSRGCHYDCPTLSSNKFSEIIVTEIALHRNNFAVNAEKMLPFLEWLIYHSYYAPFIIDPDIEFIKENNGLLVSGNTPYKLLQNLMITTRHFRECNAAAFDFFNTLTQEEGVDPYFAYVISFLSTISSGAKIMPDYPVGAYGGHRAFPFVGMQHLTYYYEKKAFADDLGVPFKEKASIMGGSSLFGLNSPENVSLFNLRGKDKEFFARVSEFRKKAASLEGYKPPNPFSPSAPKSDAGLTMIYQREIIPVLIPYLIEKGFIPNVKPKINT